jgi:bifunctional non-homologous end joining protein LigD
MPVTKKLDRYRDKRDPARTNEPFAAEPMHSGAATYAGRFVVHQHAARRMHYDLRIEIGGTLKSFAVPKGPTVSPTAKHLAVLTEDHPFEYLDFEAVIPAGNYGAGSMILWDTGTIHYLEKSAEAGLASGKIDFVLSGFKLRGRYGLAETKGKPGDKQRTWLLLKKVDAHSGDRDILAEEPESVLSGLRVDELATAGERAEALVRSAAQRKPPRRVVPVHELTPMRCAESGGRLDDAEALYELKLDGVRLLAERHDDVVQLRFRTQRNATALFPELVRALQALPVQRVVLDGEVVAFDARGMPSFAHLAGRIHKQDARAIALAARQKQVQYLVFDVLALGDCDLRGLPLCERKQLLAELLPGKGFVRRVEHAVGDGRGLFKFCQTYDLEGVIGKRADSKYEGGGERSHSWWKIKHVHSDDFVVVGYTVGKGGRNSFGALELASYIDGALVTRGRVGSGLDDAAITELMKTLEPHVEPECAAGGELMPAPHGRVFVSPRVVVSVTHSGFTEDGRLRHPVYRGIRTDVSPDDCVAAPDRDQEDALTAPVKEPVKTSARVKLTNTKKVFWPDEGITKGELCAYYEGIAEQLLPYLHDRPVLLVRYPDGITGKNFYQWNVPQGTPSWVRTETIHSDDDHRDVTYFRVEDRDTLLYIANLGAIPLHILAGRFSHLDRCDFLTIDFDLGEAPFEHAVTLALELRAVLDAIELPGFPKTSGQTGLHVLVPTAGAPFTAAVALANLLGRLVHARHPTLSTLERMRVKRPKAVYIDTGQTGRSRAIVSPYSVRAVPGARVSTPLSWDEVSAGLSPARHTLFNVPERLATRGDLMAGLLTAKPNLTLTMTRLAEQLRSVREPT